MDIHELLTNEEILALEPYLVLRLKEFIHPNEHNDKVIEAYLLGKVERENR